MQDGTFARAMDATRDRYFVDDLRSDDKLVPQGIEGQVPYQARSPRSPISSSTGCARRWPRRAQVTAEAPNYTSR